MAPNSDVVEKHSTQVTVTNLPNNCTAAALRKLLDVEADYWILRVATKELELKLVARDQPRFQPPPRELVAFVDFASEEQAEEACGLCGDDKLSLGGRPLWLRLGNTRRNGRGGAQKRPLKLSKCSLHVGPLASPQKMRVLWHASEKGLDLEFDFARGMVRWYFQTSDKTLNTARGAQIDVVLSCHLRDIRRVRELRDGVGGVMNVPLLIELWKPPRVSYRLPARDKYVDPKLEERFLW